MAGHSKFANIRHRKGAQDAKRGKLFTKLIREISVAARMGGADLSSNARLRDAVEKAYKANMTKDTISRAINRGAGGQEGGNLEEVCYEGYGPFGVAVIVDCLTDNRNRTVAEVRHAFSKLGGNLGTEGSVAYLFSTCGLLIFPAGTDENSLLEAALNAGADDVIPQADGSIEVRTSFANFHAIKDALTTFGFEPELAEVTRLASTSVPLSTRDEAEKLCRLIDLLEDLDDVQHVYTNADIADNLLGAL